MKHDWSVRIRGTKPFYETAMGIAYCGDALKLIRLIPKNVINLIMTSPPFALTRKKSYDNINADEYVEWFLPFAHEFYRVLRNDGSFVLHIGGSWTRGKPVKNLYIFELLIRLCRDVGFYLAQDMYWYNKAKLPGPAQWVTVKRIRLKDAVEHIWWLSKSPFPKADNREVLKKYSKSMEELLRNPNYYKPNVTRPSGHVISTKFYNNNGGAIPANFFDFSNTNSQSRYMRLCRKNGIKPHPARYPLELPSFFIKLLTNEGDLIVDPFGGSNTTGEAAEKLNRRWLIFEIFSEYLEGSKFRFDSIKEPLKHQKSIAIARNRKC